MPSKKPPMRRRRGRPGVGDDQKVRWAMERYTLDPSSGDFPSYEELAFKYGKPKSVIQQAVTSALREGLVNIRVSAAPPVAKQNLELEMELIQNFDLRQALVLEESGTLGSDDLHQELGWMLGRYLASQAAEIFDRNTLIVVSGGRAVHFAVTALRDTAPSVRWPPVSVGSLTGSVGDRPVIRPLEKRVTMLDGDAQASWLCCCFGSGTMLHVVAHSIAVRAEDADRTLRHSWLTRDWRRPSVAIVGLGALHEGHRLFRHMHDQGDQGPGFLGPIPRYLEALFVIAKAYSTEHYSPVADLCQRFFFVDPPPDVVIDPKDRHEAERLIAAINACLITVSFENLAQSQRIYVVAGGALKSRALYHLLTQPSGDTRIPVHALATNQAVAQQLKIWAKSEGTPRVQS